MPDQKTKAAGLPRRFAHKYFSSQLDFRVRFFNVLAIGGAIISLLVAISGVFIHTGVANIILAVFCAILACLLLQYAYHSGRYQFCYVVTIVTVFLLFFPIFFFSSGGYRSGMPSFFIFAVLFTVFMLEGAKVFILMAIELAEYIAVCVIARYWPQTVNWLDSDAVIWFDIIFAFSVVSIVLGICLFLHFRIYDQQQRKLDEQNTVLELTNRMKTEFLANASHEMRTPLTVTSVNVQTVMEILEDMGEAMTDPEAGILLQSAQDEIMRLSRMVGGMLTLASMSESTDRQRLDLSPLLHSGIEMLRLNLRKRGIVLETKVEPGLTVFGNADLLAQVLSNILQNAGAHTENGVVTVSAKRQGDKVLVKVRDTGAGIAAELLPHVFERGISTGGTGFGLYLCKTVVESHGGAIWIESEPGHGTAVSYTLPFYEGQFGGEEG